MALLDPSEELDRVVVVRIRSSRLEGKPNLEIFAFKAPDLQISLSVLSVNAWRWMTLVHESD